MRGHDRSGLTVLDEMKETAARYREEAKRLFLEIENCSLVTAEVRETCTQLKKKIAAPASKACTRGLYIQAEFVTNRPRVGEHSSLPYSSICAPRFEFQINPQRRHQP